MERRWNWDRHHLHFLWYAALMEGRTELALGTAREMVRRYGAGMSDGREYVQLLPLQTLVRLERWSDVLAEPAPGQGLGLMEGYWHYARGMAYARTGRVAQARAEQERFEHMRSLSTIKRARIFGEPYPDQFMTVAQGMLAGTIARAEKRHDDAISALRKAADMDDEIGGEPPLLAAGARLALAGALLDAGKLDEAQTELAEYERLNGPSTWSYQGHARLAQARGAAEEARRNEELARVAWQKAEPRELPVL